MAPKHKPVTEANLYEVYLSQTQILQEIYARFKSEIFPIYECLLIHSSDDAFGFYAQHFLGILIHMNSSAKVFINGVLYHPENEEYHDSFIDPSRVGSYDASYGGKTANQNKALSRLSFEYLKNGLKRSNNRYNIASNVEKLMQEIVMDTRRNIFNYFYDISKARCKVISNTRFKFDTADTNDFNDQFAIYFKKHGVCFTEEMVRAMLGREGMNNIFANITNKFIEKAPRYEDLHDVHLADRLVAIAEQEQEDQKYLKQVQATKESLNQLAKDKKMEKDFNRAVREGEEADERDKEETFHLPSSFAKQKKAMGNRKNISDYDEENDHPLLNSITQRNCGSYSGAAASAVAASVVPPVSATTTTTCTTTTTATAATVAASVREVFLPPTLRELQQDKEESDGKQQAEIQAVFDSYCKERSTTGIVAEAEVAANNAEEAEYSDDDKVAENSDEEAKKDESASNSDKFEFIVDDEGKPKRKRSPLTEEQKLARRIYYSKKPRSTTESQEPKNTVREIGIDHSAIGAIRQIRQRDVVDVSHAHAAQDQSKDQLLSLLHGKFAKDISNHVLSTLFNEMSFDRKIVEYVTACNLLVELQQGQYLFVEWDKFMKIVSDLICAELNSTFDQVLREWNAEVLQRIKSMPPPVLCLDDEVKANKTSMDAFKRVAKAKVTNISISTKSKLIREFCRITGVVDVCAELRKRTVRSDFERRLHGQSYLSTEVHAKNDEMELCAIFRAVHNINPAGNTQAMRFLIEAEQRRIEDAHRDKLAKKAIKSLALVSIHSSVPTPPPSSQTQFKTSSQSDLIMGIRLQELLMYLLGKTVVFNDYACLQVDGVSTVQFCNELQRINLLRFLVLLAVNGAGDDDVGDNLLNIKLHSALKGCFYVKYNDIDYHNTGGRGWCYYNATMQLWLRSESNYELTTAAMKQYIANLESNQEFVNERIAFARHLGRVKKNVNNYFQDDVKNNSSLTALYVDSVRHAVKQFVKNQYSEGLDHAYWGNLEFVVSHDFNITGFNGVEFEQHLLPVLSDGRRWAKLKHSSLCKATESGVKIGVSHHYALNEIEHIVCSQPANYLVWSDNHFFVIESPSNQQSRSCFRALITDAVQSWLSVMRMFDELNGLKEIIIRVSEKTGDINDADVNLVSRALHFIRSTQPNESKKNESIRMHLNADGNIVEMPSAVGEFIDVASAVEQDGGSNVKLSDHVVSAVEQDVDSDTIKMSDDVASAAEQDVDSDIKLLPDVASAVAVLKQKNYKIVEQQEEIARITQVLKEYEAMVKKLTEEKKALEEEVKSLTPNKVTFGRDTVELMDVDNELDRHINSHNLDHSFVSGNDECALNVK